MTIKLGEIKNAVPLFNKLMKMDLEPIFSFLISRFVKEVEPDCNKAEEIRKKMIKEFGDENKETKEIVIVDPEKQEIFTEKFSQILDEEIEIQTKPIPMTKVDKEFRISPDALFSIRFMFDFSTISKESKKITRQEVLNFFPQIRFRSLEMPFMIAAKVCVITQQLQEISLDINNERIKLIKKFGKKTKDGKGIVDKEGISWEIGDQEIMKKFTEEFDKYISQKIDVDIPLISFESMAGIKIKPSEMIPLYYIFKEE